MYFLNEEYVKEKSKKKKMDRNLRDLRNEGERNFEKYPQRFDISVENFIRILKKVNVKNFNLLVLCSKAYELKRKKN